MFKMIGLYLNTLIIVHTSSSVIHIMNKLTLQKKLQNIVTNNVFLDTTVKPQQQNKKSKIKPFPEPEIELGATRNQSGCVTSAPPVQLRVKIVVNLFNCFDAMGRNVNKHSRIRWPHIFKKFICFCNIFTCIDVDIFDSFLKLREKVSLLKYG